MSFDSLISILSEKGKELFGAFAAGLAVLWAARDRRKNVVIGQMDVTKKAQEVITNHMTTMAKLSDRVNVLTSEMNNLRASEAACQQRCSAIELEHANCKTRISLLESKVLELRA